MTRWATSTSLRRMWESGSTPPNPTRNSTGSSSTQPVLRDISSPMWRALAIAYGPNRTGYLLAASQGNGSYTVYRRGGSNAYLQTFTVVNGGDTDGTTH